MTLTSFLNALGSPITSAYDESFQLHTQAPASKDLGFHDNTSTELTLTINNRTLTILQSPQLLVSSLPGGTTGAILWSVTPHVARYLTSPANLLSTHSVIDGSSRILELGAGATAVLAITLGPIVDRYIQSDMEYVLKLAERNVAENMDIFGGIDSGVVRSKTKKQPRGKNNKHTTPASKSSASRVDTIALDWESDDLHTHPILQSLGLPLTAVIACDCIYNESLVKPFVDTCVDACLLNRNNYVPNNDNSGESLKADNKDGKTFVIIAQELRSPDVLEHFLEVFMEYFETWRVMDEFLPQELKSTSGFVIHVGILRDS